MHTFLGTSTSVVGNVKLPGPSQPLISKLDLDLSVIEDMILFNVFIKRIEKAGGNFFSFDSIDVYFQA